MKIRFDVEKITVLLTNSTDEIRLQTNMPSPFPNWVNEKMSLSIKTAHGHGIDYVKSNFNIEPVVIDLKNR